MARAWTRTFLGFSFTQGQSPRRRLSAGALARFQARVRELTRRTRGVSVAQMVRELRKLGVNAKDAVLTARSNRGPWR